MVYFNKDVEPILFCKGKGFMAQNQYYSYHNYLYEYIERLEKNVVNQFFQLNQNTTINTQNNHRILKIIDDIKKEQQTQNKWNRLAFEDLQQNQIKMNIDFRNSNDNILHMIKEVVHSNKNTVQEIQQLKWEMTSYLKELMNTILNNGKTVLQEFENLSVIISELKKKQQKNVEDIDSKLQSILNHHQMNSEKLKDLSFSISEINNLYREAEERQKANHDNIVDNLQSMEENQIQRDEVNLEQFLFAVKQLGEMQTKQLDKVKEELQNLDGTQKEQFEQYLSEMEKLSKAQNSELEKVKSLLYDLDETQKERIDSYANEVHKLANAQEETEARRIEEQERINAQLENITTLQNEALKLLHSSRIAMVNLLRNLSIGKSVNSITVRGEEILVRRLINYDHDTDIVTFIKLDGDIIMVNAYQIMTISFPTA